MFWRADDKLAALMRDPRWVGFHRACGKDGLFFDDIDPVNDKPLKDVTDAMRGAGYQAVAFRVEKDERGYLIQAFRGRGVGADPVAAVLAAYRAAIADGDPVTPGLESILSGEPDAAQMERDAERFVPMTATEEIDIEDLIG